MNDSYLFGVNCRQQGWMRCHPQLRGLVAFIKSRCGFHGCSILLLYWLSRPQSGARMSVSVRHLLISAYLHAVVAVTSGCQDRVALRGTDAPRVRLCLAGAGVEPRCD